MEAEERGSHPASGARPSSRRSSRPQEARPPPQSRRRVRSCRSCPGPWRLPPRPQRASVGGRGPFARLSCCVKHGERNLLPSESFGFFKGPGEREEPRLDADTRERLHPRPLPPPFIPKPRGVIIRSQARECVVSESVSVRVIVRVSVCARTCACAFLRDHTHGCPECLLLRLRMRPSERCVPGDQGEALGRLRHTGTFPGKPGLAGSVPRGPSPRAHTSPAVTVAFAESSDFSAARWFPGPLLCWFTKRWCRHLRPAWHATGPAQTLERAREDGGD